MYNSQNGSSYLVTTENLPRDIKTFRTMGYAKIIRLPIVTTEYNTVKFINPDNGNWFVRNYRMSGNLIDHNINKR